MPDRSQRNDVHDGSPGRPGLRSACDAAPVPGMTRGCARRDTSQDGADLGHLGLDASVHLPEQGRGQIGRQLHPVVLVVGSVLPGCAYLERQPEAIGYLPLSEVDDSLRVLLEWRD